MIWHSAAGQLVIRANVCRVWGTLLGSLECYLSDISIYTRRDCNICGYSSGLMFLELFVGIVYGTPYQVCP